MSKSRLEISWSGKLTEEFLGERIDKVLATLLALEPPEELEPISRSQVGKLIESGRVSLNDKEITSKSYKAEEIGTLHVAFPLASLGLIEPDPNILLDIRYEDEFLCVINKAPGLIVHPGTGGERGTLVHALVARYGELFLNVGNEKRPGIVHRLDKDTSGLMVIAKTRAAYKFLSKQFLPPRTIHRTYLALTRLPPRGRRFNIEGTISAPIARDEKNRLRMGVDPKGREASTHYKVREEFKSGMLLELELETGRTHQIRLHLESIGIPIVGDPIYSRGGRPLSSELSKAVDDFSRQALHAWKLEFVHPEKEEKISFEAEPPKDLSKLFELFRGER